MSDFMQSFAMQLLKEKVKKGIKIEAIVVYL
jgi:hypothetical protein